MWKIVPEETYEHCLRIQDPDGWYTATIKWDGCIDFKRFHNYPYQKDQELVTGQYFDCVHICDIDDMIARLQAIKEIAKTHFGEWPQ